MKKDKKEKKRKRKNGHSAPQPVIPAVKRNVDSDSLPGPAGIRPFPGGRKMEAPHLWGLGQSSESGGLRYGDLKEKIPGITDMMFSQSLKDLTAQGLIQRTQFQEIPPRVEYALTPKGSSLLPVIASLYDWAVGRNEKQLMTSPSGPRFYSQTPKGPGQKRNGSFVPGLWGFGADSASY